MLLDTWRRATRVGASTEHLEMLLGEDPWLAPPVEPWPWSDLVFVGALMASALRPYARDLAQQLAPPGSDDAIIEAAAERLASSDPALMDERMGQEQRFGITWTEDGRMLAEGRRLPREGLCRSLRSRWVSRKAPVTIACFHSIEHAVARPLPDGVQALYLLDEGAPPRSPKALICPSTSARLPLGGSDSPRLMDRSQQQLYMLWSWLEPLIESGADVVIDSRREALLGAFATRWF